MTRALPETPALTEVWVAMADHFLDTETRHEIPPTALRCVAAGLGLGDIRQVWHHEVVPVVGRNAIRVAGEWAGWDRERLLAAIREVRRHRRGPIARYWDRRVASIQAGTLAALERCATFLWGAAADRERRAGELASLARLAFDLGADEVAARDPESRARLASLYPEPLLSLIAPALLPDEAVLVARRIETGLRAR